MSLTDDWKAGELRTGYYFVRLLEGYVTVAYFNGLDILICPGWEIVEILAPCDYEELLRLKEENKRMAYDLSNQGYKIKNQRHEINNRLSEINKLHNLLKKCQRAFETYADEDETCGLEEENKYAKLLLPRIDELLQKVRDNETSRN